MPRCCRVALPDLRAACCAVASLAGAGGLPWAVLTGGGEPCVPGAVPRTSRRCSACRPGCLNARDGLLARGWTLLLNLFQYFYWLWPSRRFSCACGKIPVRAGGRPAGADSAGKPQCGLAPCCEGLLGRQRAFWRLLGLVAAAYPAGSGAHDPGPGASVLPCSGMALCYEMSRHPPPGNSLDQPGFGRLVTITPSPRPTSAAAWTISPAWRASAEVRAIKLGAGWPRWFACWPRRGGRFQGQGAPLRREVRRLPRPNPRLTTSCSALYCAGLFALDRGVGCQPVDRDFCLPVGPVGRSAPPRWSMPCAS